MAKQYDFEVSTRMTVVEPEEFRSELSMLGAQFFDKPRQNGYYIEDHRGVGVRPKDQHFQAMDRFRYVHFDRVIEPYGEIGIKYIQLLMQIDPDLSSEDSIGVIDLECEIAKELHKKIGEFTLKGETFVFDKIDDLPSDRNPNSRLFVLRQKKEKIPTVNPLRVVSDFVSNTVEERSKDIFDLGTEASHGVKDGLIIGITDETNPDKIKSFKEKFQKNVIGKDLVYARAHEIEVHAKNVL